MKTLKNLALVMALVVALGAMSLAVSAATSNANIGFGNVSGSGIPEIVDPPTDPTEPLVPGEGGGDGDDDDGLDIPDEWVDGDEDEDEMADKFGVADLDFGNDNDYRLVGYNTFTTDKPMGKILALSEEKTLTLAMGEFAAGGTPTLQGFEITLIPNGTALTDDMGFENGGGAPTFAGGTDGVKVVAGASVGIVTADVGLTSVKWDGKLKVLGSKINPDADASATMTWTIGVSAG